MGSCPREMYVLTLKWVPKWGSLLMLATGALNEVEGREFVRFRVGAPSWGKMEVYFLCVGFSWLPLDCSVYPPLKTVCKAAANQSPEENEYSQKS